MKKNFLKKIVMGLAFSLCAAVSFTTVPVTATTTAKADNSDFACAYSSSPQDGQYCYFGSTQVITYTAEEAAAAGVPAGYEGQVLQVVGAASAGVLLDFSAQQIPINLVKSFTFRFYAGVDAQNTGGKPQLRIPKPFAMNSWVYQPGDTPSKTGEWTTETVEKDFSALADKNGILDKFELGLRSNAKIPFYIDSIAVNLLADDGVAPVLTYNGADSIILSQGAEIKLDVSAYDAQEKCEKAIEYVWEDGVTLDEKGVPTQTGEYQLTLRASDYYGNTSQKTIQVTVEEVDLEAPVIHLDFTKMYVQVGTTPVLNVKVTDNRAVLETTRVWSEGALDKYGRLTEGTHTYTVTAKDTSGNQSQKVLTVYVTVDEPTDDNVIDEDTSQVRYTVTFDGVASEKAYKYGEKVEKPANPTKEDTDHSYFVFIGWYNGDKKWDFDKDVVLSDLQLVSKWKEFALEGASGDNSSASADVESSEQSSEQTSEESNAPQSSESVQSPTTNSQESVENGATSLNCFSTVGVTAYACILLGVGVWMCKSKKENE